MKFDTIFLEFRFLALMGMRRSISERFRVILPGGTPESSCPMIELITDFSNFDRGQITQVHQHSWKEHLKMS